MGNNSPCMQQYDVALAFHRQDWIPEAVHLKYQLWKHRQTLQQVQVYSLNEPPSIADMNIYQRRSKSQDLVRIINVNLDLDNSLCGQCHPQLLVQHIAFRLYNVNYLNIHEAFTVLCAVLRGYDLIKDFSEAAQPNQQLVGFNREGRPKIWLNKQFNLNTLPFTGNLKQQKLASDKFNQHNISSIINKIYEMVEQRTSFKLLPLSVKQIFCMNCQSYKTALVFLQQYCLKNNINIKQRISKGHLINKNYHNHQFQKSATKIQQARPYILLQQIAQINRNNSRIQKTNKFIRWVGMHQHVYPPSLQLQNNKALPSNSIPTHKINFIQNNQIGTTFNQPSHHNQQTINQSFQPIFKQPIFNHQQQIVQDKAAATEIPTKHTNIQEQHQLIENINLVPIQEHNISVAQQGVNLQQSQLQSPRFYSSDSRQQTFDIDEQKSLKNLRLDNANKQGGQQNENQESAAISPYFNISPALTINSERFHQFVSYKPSQENIQTEKVISDYRLVTFKKVEFSQDFPQTIPSYEYNLHNSQANVTPRPQVTSVESRLQIITKPNPPPINQQTSTMQKQSIYDYTRQRYNLKQQQQSRYSKDDRQQLQQDDYINDLQKQLLKFAINKDQTVKRLIPFEHKLDSTDNPPIHRIKSYTMNDLAAKYETYTYKQSRKQDLSTKQQQSQNKSSRKFIYNQKDRSIVDLNKNELLSDRLQAKKYLESRKKSHRISYEQLRPLIWK